MNPPIILCGLPGAGKTTLGKYLAAALNLPFADSDELITQQEGKSVSEIFSTRGEAYFRKREAEVIAQTLTDFTGVLALGGGAVQTESTRQLLREHVVVYLNISLPCLFARLENDQSRPLLADKSTRLAKLEALAQARCQNYQQIASWEIQVDQLSLAEQAQELIERLGLSELVKDKLPERENS